MSLATVMMMLHGGVKPATCSWSLDAALALSRSVGPKCGASPKAPLLHVVVMDEDEDEGEHCRLCNAAQIGN